MRLVAQSPHADKGNEQESSRLNLRETESDIGAKASRKRTGKDVPRAMSWEGIGNEDFVHSVRSSSVLQGGYHETGPECESADSHDTIPMPRGGDSDVVRRFKYVDDQERMGKERPRSEILETRNDLIDKESKKRMKKKASVKERLGRVFGRDSTKTSQKISLPLNRTDRWKKSRSLDKLDSDEVLDLKSERKKSEPEPLKTDHHLEIGTRQSPRTVARIIAETAEPSSDEQAGSSDSVRHEGSSSRAKVRRKRKSLYEIPPPPPPPPKDGEESEEDSAPAQPIRCFSNPDIVARTPDGQQKWPPGMPERTSFTQSSETVIQSRPYVNLSRSEGNVIESSLSKEEKKLSLNLKATYELQSSPDTNTSRFESNAIEDNSCEHTGIQASKANDFTVNRCSLPDQVKENVCGSIHPIQSMPFPRTSSYSERKTDLNIPKESQNCPDQNSEVSEAARGRILHSATSTEPVKQLGNDDRLPRSQSYSTSSVHSRSVDSHRESPVSPTQTNVPNSQSSVRRQDHKYEISDKPISHHPNTTPAYIPKESRVNSQSSSAIPNENEMSESLIRTFSDPLPSPVRHVKSPRDNHIEVIPPPPENLRYTPKKIPHSMSVSQISSNTRQNDVHPTRALSDPAITPATAPEVPKEPYSCSKIPMVAKPVKPVVPAKPSVPPKPVVSPKPLVSSKRVSSPKQTSTRSSDSTKSKAKERVSPSAGMSRGNKGKREMMVDKHVHQGTHDDNDDVFVKPPNENKLRDSGPVRKRRSSLPEEDLMSLQGKMRGESKPRPKTLTLQQEVHGEGVFTVQVCKLNIDVTNTKLTVQALLKSTSSIIWYNIIHILSIPIPSIIL